MWRNKKQRQICTTALLLLNYRHKKTYTIYYFKTTKKILRRPKQIYIVIHIFLTITYISLYINRPTADVTRREENFPQLLHVAVQSSEAIKKYGLNLFRGWW